jgi:hypothetical protein
LLEKRVEILEDEMQTLRELPDRVASLEVHILQFREEVRGEFSALRNDVRAGDEETRSQLRGEMRTLNDATLTHMRVLHEDVISRIALLDEHWNGRPPRDGGHAGRKHKR